VFDYHLLGKLPKDTPAPLRGRGDGDSDADLRDVPESVEPEPLSPAEAARR
jgi:hypothetical protein